MWAKFVLANFANSMYYACAVLLSFAEQHTICYLIDAKNTELPLLQLFFQALMIVHDLP